MSDESEQLRAWKEARIFHKNYSGFYRLPPFHRWIEEKGIEMFDDAWVWQKAEGIELVFAVKLAIRQATRRDMERDGATFNYKDDFTRLERVTDDKMRSLDKKEYPQLVQRVQCSAIYKGSRCPKRTYHHSELCMFHRG